MKTLILAISLVFSTLISFGQANCDTNVDYGNNAEIGQFASVNGLEMYFETYGDSADQPLLIIHGNGGSIKSEICQIEYFKDDYFIIVADSRFHGKTTNGDQRLTFELMASDYTSLLDYLNIDSSYIIGLSDGGIIGLLLAMNYPNKVSKLVSNSPNLRPDSTAVWQWDIDNVSNALKEVESKIVQGETSAENFRAKEHLNLLDKHPNIERNELKRIKAPVLVMAGDADLIKLRHILEIYESIPKSQLMIMPGATHDMPSSKHELFNQMVERFLSNPFERPTAR